MKHLLTISLIFIGLTASAQQSVKGGIVAYNNGEYDRAVQILAVEMDSEAQLKEKDRANGWYYLGMAKSNVITNAMAKQEKEKLQESVGFDLDAYVCFQKALKEKLNENLTDDIIEEIQSLSYVLFNSGNMQYLIGENSAALKYYDAAQEIAEEYGMRNDYQVYQYKAQTQLAIGDSTASFDNNKKAILRYNSQAPEIPDANIGYAFYSKAILERFTFKDLDNALATVQEGVELIDSEVLRLKNALSEGPSNEQMLAYQLDQFDQVRDALTRFELEIYTNSPAKYEEAVAKFKQAIKDNPRDPNLYLVYGNLIEYQDIDGAFEAYKSALDIDPSNPAAQFNAGANRVNKGVAFARLANEEIDFQKANEWQEKTNEQFRIALPYLEKGHTLAPEDLYIVEALMQVYAQLEMMDEYKTFKEKRKALSGY